MNKYKITYSYRKFEVLEVEANNFKEAVTKTIKNNKHNNSFKIHLTDLEHLKILK